MSDAEIQPGSMYEIAVRAERKRFVAAFTIAEHMEIAARRFDENLAKGGTLSNRELLTLRESVTRECGTRNGELMVRKDIEAIRNIIGHLPRKGRASAQGDERTVDELKILELELEAHPDALKPPPLPRMTGPYEKFPEKSGIRSRLEAMLFGEDEETGKTA